MNIYLISSILYDDGIFDHFINHYISQGVDKFIFGLYKDSNIDINKYSKKYTNIDIQFVTNEISRTKYTGKYDTEFRNKLKYFYLNNNDWYIIADLDEFIKPQKLKLKNIIETADNSRNDIIYGTIIDRICGDGNIPSFIDNNIWKQFDTNIDLTDTVFNNSRHKIVAAKSFIDAGPGHHYPIGCAPWENKEYLFFLNNNYSQYKMYLDIFHFKWKVDVLNISKTILSNQQDETYLLSIIKYLDTNKNRIF